MCAGWEGEREGEGGKDEIEEGEGCGQYDKRMKRKKRKKRTPPSSDSSMRATDRTNARAQPYRNISSLTHPPPLLL